MKQQSFNWGPKEIPTWVKMGECPGSDLAACDSEFELDIQKVRLLQVSNDTKSAYCVEYPTKAQIDKLYSRPTIWFNGVSDWHVLHKVSGTKPEIGNTFDLFLASQVLFAGLPIRHSLAANAKRFLGISMDKTLAKQDWGKPVLNPEDWEYAGNDPKITLALWEPLRTSLDKANLYSVAKMESEAAHCFWELEHFGTYVRIDVLRDCLQAYNRARDKIREEWKQKYRGYSITSSSQVFSLFRDKLTDLHHKLVLEGLPDSKPGMRNPYEIRTQDWALANLKLADAETVRLDRSLTKYIEKIESLIEACEDCEFESPWKTIRTNYRQIAFKDDRESGTPGKGMGRSSSGPPINWQNIGKYVAILKRLKLPNKRSAICPPPGYSMIIIDLSNGHGRIAAATSKDPFLCAVYSEGKDIHSEVGFDLAKAKGLPWKSASELKAAYDDEDLDAANIRQGAKNGFFGNLNGQGGPTLWRTCWSAPDPIKLSIDECKHINVSLKKKLSTLERFKKQLVRKANSRTVKVNGKIYGTLVGPTKRRQHFEKIQDGNWPDGRPKEASILGPQAWIFYWMSAESSVVKHAIVDIVKKRNPEWDLRLQLLPHDELVAIVKSKFKLPAATLVQQSFRYWMNAVLRGVVPPDDGKGPESLIKEHWGKK